MAKEAQIWTVRTAKGLVGRYRAYTAEQAIRNAIQGHSAMFAGLRWSAPEPLRACDLTASVEPPLTW